MSRNEANESISVFPFISNYMRESNQQFQLLIDWTSAIYLNMRLETIALVNSFIFPVLPLHFFFIEVAPKARRVRKFTYFVKNAT
jgi:hypothetical protein